MPSESVLSESIWKKTMTWGRMRSRKQNLNQRRAPRQAFVNSLIVVASVGAHGWWCLVSPDPARAGDVFLAISRMAGSASRAWAIPLDDDCLFTRRVGQASRMTNSDAWWSRGLTHRYASQS